MIKPYNRAELHFDTKERIGMSGANSEVFIAFDHQLGADIAVKKINKAKIDDCKFFEESQRLYMSAHENVVGVLYACEDKDNIYIAMPYYQKGSLKNRIDKKFLTVREIIRYSCQFLSGVHNIHSKKLIHFDIKPDNVLLSDRDEAMVADFGLTKPTDFSGIAGQDRLYIKHIPPEAFDHQNFDRRFDIYQIGMTLYRMCNGNNCFDSQMNEFLNEKKSLKNREDFKFAVKNSNFPDRQRFLLHIPNSLQKIVIKCLNPTPDLRYKSVLEITNDLGKIGGDEEILDWQYCSDQKKEVWVKEAEDKTIILEMANGKSQAKKIMKLSGREQKITKYNNRELSKREIGVFLKEF